MSNIVVGFSHDKSDCISRLIAWMTRGSVSHVVLFKPDMSEAIEASSYGRPRGVRRVVSADFMRKPNATLRYIKHPDPAAVYRIAESQIGCGYDYAYLFGWIFRSKIERKNRWVCHELVAWACAEAGHPVIDMGAPHTLTPQHLYLISNELAKA